MFSALCVLPECPGRSRQKSLARLRWCVSCLNGQLTSLSKPSWPHYCNSALWTHRTVRLQAQPQGWHLFRQRGSVLVTVRRMVMLSSIHCWEGPGDRRCMSVCSKSRSSRPWRFERNFALILKRSDPAPLPTSSLSRVTTNQPKAFFYRHVYSSLCKRALQVALVLESLAVCS